MSRKSHDAPDPEKPQASHTRTVIMAMKLVNEGYDSGEVATAFGFNGPDTTRLAEFAADVEAGGTTFVHDPRPRGADQA